MTHKQVIVRTKETIHKAMHVMRCPVCGNIAASASERKYLPNWTVCSGKELTPDVFKAALTNNLLDNR